MVSTVPRASFMASVFSSTLPSGLKLSMAVTPWGTVLLGMTTTFLGVRPSTCWAAIMIFLLLGRMNTVSAGTLFTASRMSWVLGFMVWPPEMIPSTPRLPNTSPRPLPAQTLTTPRDFSGSAIFGDSSCSLSTFSVCCRRIFSIFTVTKEPYFRASCNAVPGLLVCTWTLMISSSSTSTRLSPSSDRNARSSSGSLSFSRETMNSVQ